MSDASAKAAFEALGMHLDTGLLESAVMEPGNPLHLILPLNLRPTPSTAASTFLLTILGDGERDALVDPIAVIAVGFGGAAALHVRLSPQDLRQLAAGCQRAADLLDQGRGKQ
jgi:hypothetical protein